MTVLFVTRVRRAERLIFTERCIAERSYLNGKPFVSLFMTLTYPDHQELKTFLSLPVEFSVTYFGRSLIISDTIGLCSASVAYMLILHSLLVSLQRFVHDTVTVIICIWDVTVASTLAGSYVDTAATGAGFVADQAADRKTAKYADLRAQ